MSNTRVAIVTGAAQGIGRAIALRLAHDGLDVVVNDLESKSKELDTLVTEILALGRKGLAVVGNMCEEADVDSLVSKAVAAFGGLDVMIANAGIGRTSPLVSTSLQDWELVQGVNVRSVFLSYKAAAIQMIKQGRGGRIIGASSVAGKQGFPEWGAYGASKFAIRGLTQSAAAELGKHNITVNAYAPGLVDTSILRDIEAHRESHDLGKLPVNPDWKFLLPEDVAGLVSYLAREEARFVTGQSININAGMVFD